MSANTQTPSILNPESIKKLFEDAENIEKKLEKRNKEINNLSVL
jgi:tetrahydromethanopterin S-methyltransferase subunit G